MHCLTAFLNENSIPYNRTPMADTCQNPNEWEQHRDQYIGIIFMNISNSLEIIWEDDWQVFMVVLKHESCNQVLVDVKEFDNHLWTLIQWDLYTSSQQWHV